MLPDVGSMIVPPGLSLPVASASSIIDSAMRSLIEPPGFARSDLIQTLAAGAEQPVDADVRRVADGFEDVRGFHEDLVEWREGSRGAHMLRVSGTCTAMFPEVRRGRREYGCSQHAPR